jgi:hypothetical protein
MSFALDGVRVLELARFQAGPRGGMVLSDLGAEVIKIEPPGGEETRKHPPMVRGQSVYFTVYNRGKKSVCLDMRSEGGKEIFAALVQKSDVVLENFRPGVMRAMGFDYERLRALNPGIILVSVSGFGQYGPYMDRPAFDPLGQAMSGLMTLTGQPVGQPLGTASSVVDRYTALHATIGTLAASTSRAYGRRGRWWTCACSTPRSRWWRSRRPTTWRRVPREAKPDARRIARGRLGGHQRGGREMAEQAHASRRPRGEDATPMAAATWAIAGARSWSAGARSRTVEEICATLGRPAFPSARCGRSPRWRRTRTSGSARCS